MGQAITILTVAYHSHGALTLLGRDLSRQRPGPVRWLVVNNAPRSAPLQPEDVVPAGNEMGGRLEVIEGMEAEGFGAGCNRGFEHLAQHGWQDWVWLLNPDTRLPIGNELSRLADGLITLSPRALVGTAVRSADGEMEPSAGWIDPGLRFRSRRVSLSHLDAGEPVLLDWLSGCSLCLRPDAHHPPARFDPAFLLYYEDMDLCLRLGRNGAPVIWLPAPVIHHQRGAGSSTSSPRRLQLSTVSYLHFLRVHCASWVVGIRALRLLVKSLLLLPVRPGESLAVLAALPQGLRRP
jgi:N-acetylglucosaminyl-diphospho-decaprenol L-rhamnosyltransferase